MKNIVTFLLTCLLSSALHAFDGSTNNATVAFSNAPSGNFSDWSFKIYSNDDSTFTINVSDGNPSDDFQWQFAMKGRTGIVHTIYNTNITAASGSGNVTFQLFRTNMVEAGTYYTELRAFTSGTNVSAVAGQGRITVLKSLF